MAAFSRSLLLTALLGAAPGGLPAQQVEIAGQIIRQAAPGDTVAVPDARVVLHRVTPETQGALDSIRTTGAGQFRFTTPRDTSGLYLISARHAGIEFFSDPIRLPAAGPPGPVSLLVSDTSSTQPVALAARYVVIGSPDAERRRTIVDLFVLSNSGVAARVSADSMAPTWSAVLPAAVGHRIPEAGSEVSASAVAFAGDTVRIFAPISPGQRQLLVEHTIEAGEGRLVVPIGPEDVPLQVVTEEPGAAVRGGGMVRAESQVIDGRPLERWTGNVPAGALVVVDFPGPSPNERRVAVGLAALVGTLLLLGAVLAIRRPKLAALPPRR